ncbi:hypothetical protein SDC9_159268 [bioreactor metagenome]|uniref:Uncharacterized protein n=1 Tax=bioreactor metagenome TaxID=1076179 RepID=A0A645FF38_9ZZZZ
MPVLRRTDDLRHMRLRDCVPFRGRDLQMRLRRTDAHVRGYVSGVRRQIRNVHGRSRRNGLNTADHA